MQENILKAIEQAEQLTKGTASINLKGKKYLMVKDRINIFRKMFFSSAALSSSADAISVPCKPKLARHLPQADDSPFSIADAIFTPLFLTSSA